ncbi:MAG: hypothetical protein A2096_06300 [Spirochaetes bacterium GWF1_41_5]|nr:MAG: hypothetical protein A2096_06300 [Spirochaetes bacterium GWF1_41_5]
MLPVSYFHVVLTVPRELNNLFLWNRRKMYSLLLKMVSRTIIDSAGRNLGICKTGVLIITKIRAFYESNIIGGCAPPCPA